MSRGDVGLPYLAHVDGLRAVAIVLVVAFHAWPQLVPGGYLGVDVFFVISGFIITRQLQAGIADGTFSYLRFLANRVRRLIPAVFVCSIFVTIASLVFLSPIDLVDYAKGLIAAWLMVANFYFMRTTGYFDGPAEEKPLLHFWSLAVEDQFYLTWPLLLLVLLRWVGLRWSLMLVLPALILASLGHAEFSQSENPQYAFFSPLTRAFELLAGCWLALVMVGGTGPSTIIPFAARSVAGLLGAILVIGSSILLNETSPVPGLMVLPVVVGTVLLIYSGLAGSTVTSQLLSSVPLVFVGRVSYSWYLYHWPFLALSRHALGRAPTDFEAFGLVVASFVAAVLSWAYIEQPFRKQELAVDRAFFGVVTASVAFCVIAGVVIAGRGLPGRLDEPRAQLYMAKHEGNPYRRSCDGIEYAFSNDAACNFGAPKKEQSYDVVVLGDSNADHFVPMLSVLAKRKGLSGRQITHSTCAPLLGFMQSRASAYRKETCTRYQETVLQFLDRNPDLKFVVLSAVWANWQDRLAPNRVADELALQTKRLAGFPEALNSTVSFLRSRGLTVILIGQIPHMRSFEISCLEEAVRRPVADPSACATPRRVVERRHLQRPRREFSRLATSMQEIRFFDPSKYLCKRDYCSPFDGRALLYRDFGHLNARGSEYLAKYAEDLFD